MSRSSQARARRPGPGPRALREVPSGDVASDVAHPIPGITILPLRAFLGITFVYAAIQKLTDPGFLTPGAPTYIGAQLIAFGRNSPIHFLLVHFAEHAIFFGLLTIVAELAIGVAVLLGMFTRLAALAGMGLNFVFFLSASWTTFPYFMGADIVFVVAWLTVALTGPGPYSVDARSWRRLRAVVGPDLAPYTVGPVYTSPSTLESPAPSHAITRRDAMIAGLGAIVLVILGVIPRARPSVPAAAPATSGSSSPSSGAPPPSTGSSGGGGTTPAGTKVGTVSQLPANSAMSAVDPKTGDPAVIVHTSGSNFYAYDAVCTHAGCTVEWDPQFKLLVCPCHGGAFDPAHGAAVVAGPPPAPLTQLPITIDKQGNILLA